MKINRLLEITILLLNRGSITAGELAERFQVSTRTVYRDIDVLSSAGVPVYTSKGSNGGIRLLENYALNKAIINDQEIDSLVIYPRIVGRSIGFGGLWILVSLILGGSLFGMTGIIIGIPAFAFIYAVVRNSTANRLRRKDISVT
jgi:hypothetical protein